MPSATELAWPNEPPRASGLPHTTAFCVERSCMDTVSMIQAMICSSVATSELNTSRSGPTSAIMLAT